MLSQSHSVDIISAAQFDCSVIFLCNPKLEIMVNSLSKEMRVATREIHKISDAMVNAKLAFGEIALGFFASNVL